jgi:ParB-like chromosome segregation protein Spo0J
VTAKEGASVGDAGPQGKRTTSGRFPSTTEIAPSTAAVKFHPLADMFPPMEGKEFDALVADIKANGLNEPIAIYEDMILDGRNRYRACIAAGVKPEFEDLICIADPVAYVISANIHRRNLTPEQKAEVLAKLVAAQPEKSDRELAKQAKVSHPTIAKARRKAEATGKALPVEKRVGADGKARRQPAKKAKRKLTRRQQQEEQQRLREESRRRLDEEADKVVAVLIERLGRDGFVLIAAAFATRAFVLEAIDRQIKGTPAEKIVEGCILDVDTFIAKFGKPAATDAEASTEAMKARFAADEAAS